MAREGLFVEEISRIYSLFFGDTLSVLETLLAMDVIPKTEEIVG